MGLKAIRAHSGFKCYEGEAKWNEQNATRQAVSVQALMGRERVIEGEGNRGEGGERRERG